MLLHLNPSFVSNVFANTTTPHIPFQIRFCFELNSSKWKLSKWHGTSLCCMNTIPTHLKHRDHALWAIVHSKNKCCIVLSFSWQRAHEGELITITTLLIKLIWVGILSSRILQAVVNTLGIPLACHSCLNTSSWELKW